MIFYPDNPIFGSSVRAVYPKKQYKKAPLPERKPKKWNDPWLLVSCHRYNFGAAKGHFWSFLVSSILETSLSSDWRPIRSLPSFRNAYASSTNPFQRDALISVEQRVSGSNESSEASSNLSTALFIKLHFTTTSSLPWHLPASPSESLCFPVLLSGSESKSLLVECSDLSENLSQNGWRNGIFCFFRILDFPALEFHFGNFSAGVSAPPGGKLMENGFLLIRMHRLFSTKSFPWEKSWGIGSCRGKLVFKDQKL